MQRDVANKSVDEFYKLLDSPSSERQRIGFAPPFLFFFFTRNELPEQS
jgi:hypothetical protein